MKNATYPTFRITGHVIDAATHVGVAGLRVEAWDKDLLVNDLVGEAVTDAKGDFLIEFTEAHFRELFFDRRPDLFFRVFDGDVLLVDTRKSVLANVEPGASDVIIEIARSSGAHGEGGGAGSTGAFAAGDTGGSATAGGSLRVSGTVTYADGTPARSLTVRAFDRDMRSEELLGETTTGEKGEYVIFYTAAQFARAEKRSADLAVKVFSGAATSGAALYEPSLDEVLFNAPDDAVVDIRLRVDDPNRSAEYDAILADVTVLAGDVPIDQVREDGTVRDITFLSRESGWAVDKLGHLVVAARLSAVSNITPEFFYALLRENTLLAVEPGALTRARFAITPADETLPLFYDIVLFARTALFDAVHGAVAHNTVKSALVDGLESIGAVLDSFRAAAEAYVKDQAPAQLRELIARNLVAGTHDEVLKILSEDAMGDIPGLIARLANVNVLKPETDAEGLHATMLLGEILGRDVKLVEAVKEEHGIETPDGMRKLAGLNPTAWRTTLSAAAARTNVSVPEGVIAAQASLMARKLEREFPTAAFAAQLGRAAAAHGAAANDGAHAPSVPHAAAIAELLEAHPDLDLAATNIPELLRARATSAKSGAAANAPANVDEGVVSSMKMLQRLFKFAPTYRKTMAMVRAGIGSAADIAALGEERTVRELAADDLFTESEARSTFRKASDVHAAAALIASEMAAAVHGADVHALGAGPQAKTLQAVSGDFPDLKMLFKLTDVCECEHCRSVYSPAAYMVEVMQFLNKRRAVDTTAGNVAVNARDLLLSRRPDLGDIDLSCDNANTPLPYIDIVCEQLEEQVAPDAGIGFSGVVAKGKASDVTDLVKTLTDAGLPFTSGAVVFERDRNNNFIVRDEKAVCAIVPNGVNTWKIKRLRQTYRSAAELAAAPEYVNKAAYNTLRGANIAFDLPFDLDHTETREYFGKFDIARDELMAALAMSGTPRDYEIAADALGLSDAERALIVNAHADLAHQQEYWNTGAADPTTALAVVDTFLTRARLEYADLEELLRLRFVNPGGTMFIKHADATCNTATKTIQGLTLAGLDRFHRFIRLRRALGWDARTLDDAIMAPRIGAGALNDGCLVALRDLARLSDRLGPAVELLIPFYDLLNAGGNDARYAATFANATANGTVPAVFLPDGVRANEAKELATPGTGEKLATHAKYLAICLGTTSGEIDTLLADIGAGAVVSFVNLSALYQRARVAAALELSAADLITLRGLTGTAIVGSPADTLKFAEQRAHVRAAGIGAADLRYLLEQKGPDAAQRAMTTSAIAGLLGVLRAGYKAAAADNASKFDGTATADELRIPLREELARLPNPADHKDPSFIGEEDLALFIALLDNTFSHPTWTPDTFLDAKLRRFFDTTTAKARRADIAAAAGTKEPERKAFAHVLLDAIAAWFYDAGKGTVLTAAVSAALSLDADLAGAFIELGHLRAPVAFGAPGLRAVLTDESLLNVVLPLDNANYPQQFAAVRLLRAMSQLVEALGLGNTSVAWMLRNNIALGWTPLDAAPYADDVAIPPITLADWEMLRDAIALIGAYPPVAGRDRTGPPLSFLSVLEYVISSTPTIAPLLEKLAAVTGLDRAVLEALDARFQFSAGSLNAYKLPATYRRLERAAGLLRRLGLGVADGVALVKATLDSNDAALIRRALKARYDDATWLGVLGNIQDRLRVRKRDALVGYLLAKNPSLKSTNDLFDYFLIDVEIAPCAPTSRIVSAHGTLQLFAQRCLLGLEPKGVANVKQDSGWNQWTWMRNYRVWEANRKVFLYPENWIEPELRDDKSQFFTALESTLLQNELNDRAVENAAGAYLEQLDQTAFLEVVAMHNETAERILHVFARTKGGDPAVYYYRRFERERYWTPWEKVDLDISGDHLIAFMRNNRLYLAWPIFTDEPDADQQNTIPSSTVGTKLPKTRKRLNIQIAISEYAAGRWLPKRVSKEGLRTPYWYYKLPERRAFRFYVADLGKAGYVIGVSYTDNGVFEGDVPAYGTVRYPGVFTLTGCKGYPEPVAGGGAIMNYYRIVPQFRETEVLNQRHQENASRTFEDLAAITIFNLRNYLTILEKTPGTFKVTYPDQMSLIDTLLFLLEVLQQSGGGSTHDYRLAIPMGSFMPWFYEDGVRNYVVVPGFFDAKTGTTTRKTFSDILEFTERAVALTLKYLKEFNDDPNHDVALLLDHLVHDAEYIALAQELAVYLMLLPGNQFRAFYHPLVCRFRATLYADGIPALMDRSTQLADTGFVFEANEGYKPTAFVRTPYPKELVDFSLEGSYSGYNWELFFHLPFLIAVRLSADQRFEEAMNWFHYIFNPIGASDDPAPKKYWVTRPFYEMTEQGYQDQRIDSILYALAKDPTGAAITELKFAVEQWRAKPFRPHVIARSRPVAYQKAVVMKYIDNLIAWGDSLFRQDTMESVNQATQMYVLADKLLGSRPRVVPPVVKPPYETYNQLAAKIDLFGNALVEFENMIPDLDLLPHHGDELPVDHGTLAGLYFCIPQNDKALEYWDRVEDRLFKIRHCQNIDGVERRLALFSPPIDPGALVRAAAAGLDIGAVIAGMNAPLPLYRFNVLAAKATELTSQVNALGGALLAAMEKRDAEALARLRSEQEMRVLSAVRGLKERQIEEAKSQIEALNRSKAVIKERLDYYTNIPRIIPHEQEHLDKMKEAQVFQESAQGIQLAASIIALIPDIDLGASGFGGTPLAKFKFGGLNLAQASKAASDVLSFLSLISSNAAATASIKGGFDRRWEDWGLQKRLAEKETRQMEQQITAAEIRLSIAENDLRNHDLQIENARKSDEFMRGKFTNRELYDWMVGQISAVYFRAYQLAHDVAQKAERCYRHELAVQETSFIGLGYWDSLRKGLTSADRLLHDIKRMEVAYLDTNRREYELTRHISLAQIDPAALLLLRSTGSCTIEVPEVLYDIDHPGQYLRRIKSVSLSVPCVAGPYSTVSCKLSLVSNRYRRVSTLLSVGTPLQRYAEKAGNDERFVYNVGAIQSIATSTGQNDSGTFELNFRDDRYLPFEGAGAIGTWKLEMPSAFRQFDYNTISDVILHVRYTARDAGSAFRGAVEGVTKDLLNAMATATSGTGLFQAYNLRQDLPNEWHKLKTTGSTPLTVRRDRLPFLVQGHGAVIASAVLIARVDGNVGNYPVTVNGGPNIDLALDVPVKGLNGGAVAGLAFDVPFTLAAADTSNLEALVLVVHYTAAT